MQSKTTDDLLEEVAAAISKVEAEIRRTEGRLDSPNLSREDTAYYRDKEKLLREKEKQLRDEKKQLREKEKQLGDKEMLLLKQNHVSDHQHQHGGGDMVSEMQALRLEVHGVKEALPSVLVGHVLTPSQASRNPQVVFTVFESLGLSLYPESAGVTCTLPDNCGDEWKFNWKWPKNAGGDDRGLERKSYGPVKDYLGKLGLFCVDVSEGQFCVEKLLFNAEIYTRRNQNPMLVRGQTVYLRHRIEGRTDLAVLRQDNKGGYILRHMIKFVIELKTVHGYQQSQTGCMRECQLQLIGLNAFNTNTSPPVVLSNLARKHQVLYLVADEEWRYTIKVQDCESFAAAIHFADVLSNRDCISQHFSRPTTPDALY